MGYMDRDERGNNKSRRNSSPQKEWKDGTREEHMVAERRSSRCNKSKEKGLQRIVRDRKRRAENNTMKRKRPVK